MHGWTFDRWLLVISMVGSVLGITFGVGVNWNHITEQDARQKAFEEMVTHTYVRQDVYSVNQQNLTDSLDRLNRTLERMQEREREKQALPAVPTFRGRTFN